MGILQHYSCCWLTSEQKDVQYQQMIVIPSYLLPFGFGCWLLFNPQDFSIFFLNISVVSLHCKIKNSHSRYFWKVIKANTLFFMLDKAVWHMWFKHGSSNEDGYFICLCNVYTFSLNSCELWCQVKYVFFLCKESSCYFFLTFSVLKPEFLNCQAIACLMMT